jgi:hypothetical protein
MPVGQMEMEKPLWIMNPQRLFLYFRRSVAQRSRRRKSMRPTMR